MAIYVYISWGKLSTGNIVAFQDHEVSSNMTFSQTFLIWPQCTYDNSKLKSEFTSQIYL